MATRLGIELSPAACRIVEIEAGPAFRRRQRDTRVVSFSVLPPSGPETRAKLASLRERSAAVIVWGASREHRQVMVTGRSHESMRAGRSSLHWRRRQRCRRRSRRCGTPASACGRRDAGGRAGFARAAAPRVVGAGHNRGVLRDAQGRLRRLPPR